MLIDFLTSDMMHHEDTFGYIGYGSTAASPLVGLTPSTPSVPKFRPASKASTPAKVQERIEDGLVVKEPAKVISIQSTESRTASHEMESRRLRNGMSDTTLKIGQKLCGL